MEDKELINIRREEEDVNTRPGSTQTYRELIKLNGTW